MAYMYGCFTMMGGLLLSLILFSMSGILGFIGLWFAIMGGLLVAGMIQVSQQDKMKKKSELSMINSIPKGIKIVETKSFIANDYESKISIDDENKKVYLWINKTPNLSPLSNSANYDFNFIEIAYKDILTVEIVQDEVSITRTSRGSQIGGAIIGGAIAGGVGAIIGGSGGTQTTESEVKRIDLYITVKDIKNPIYIINFYSKEGLVKQAMLTCKEWYGILAHIIKEDIQTENNDNNENIDLSSSLKQLNELRKEGILSDEEFAIQKNKILNRF